MEKSKVYFTNMRATSKMNLLQKLERLVKKAGIEQIDFKGKFSAIKIHFGEPGNLAYLRPNYSKVIADVIKSLGGRVFLTDCNTLYVGRRKDALEHLDAAYENGYNPFTTGCQIIIGDGLKGTDESYVPVPVGEYVKEAKIGRAVMDADIIIRQGISFIITRSVSAKVKPGVFFIFHSKSPSVIVPAYLPSSSMSGTAE